MALCKKIILLSLSLLIISTTFAHSTCVNWPNHVFQPIPNPKTGRVAPDYGIYWFKNVGGRETVMRAFTPPSLAHQFSDGTINTLPKGQTLAQAKATYIKKLEKAGFFDPNKPTLIFIHGDQPTMTKKHKRIDFCYSYTESDGINLSAINTRDLWAHWNVGMFYWTAFADDVEGKGIGAFVRAITYPEMKIYNSNNKAGMRWAYLTQNGKVAFCDNGIKGCSTLPKNSKGKPLTVSMLAYLAYQNALPDNYHQPLRIAGQSLGTQVAIQLAGLVSMNDAVPQPNELILLDPYFTPEIHKLTVTSGQKTSAAKYSYEVAKGLLQKRPKLGFAIYRSTKLSEWPTGTRNHRLEKLSAYLRICPTYLNNAAKKQQTVDEHISCAYIYFHSKAFPAPSNYVNANSTPEDIRKLMGTRRYCRITDFAHGCGNHASEMPINCKLEKRFGKIE